MCFKDGADTISLSCRYVKLTILRNLYRKYDYKELVDELILSCGRHNCIIYLSLSRLISLLASSPLKHSTRYNSFRCVNNKQIHAYHTLSIGGGTHAIFSREDIQPFFTTDVYTMEKEFTFVAQVHHLYHDPHPDTIRCKVPLSVLALHLPLSEIKILCRSHNMSISARAAKDIYVDACKNHNCPQCDLTTSLFRPHDRSQKFRKYQSKPNTKIKRSKYRYLPNNKSKRKQQNFLAHAKKKLKRTQFPPSHPDQHLIETIVSGFCQDTSPEVFSEAGCAVCAMLTPNSQLSLLTDLKCSLKILEPIHPGMVVAERNSSNDPIVDVQGPVLQRNLKNICSTCKKSVQKGLLPKHALANGLWIGELPKQLKHLRFAEQMLIARCRHNKCITIVKRSGMYKMRANAITYSNPTPKIYHRLPPTLEELDDVLAFIFTGPTNPTQEDFQRSPMLVRRKAVTEALEWLKLNHRDYYDLEIDYDILSTYPENGIPVVIDYRRTDSINDPEATSVHLNDIDEGVDTGECSFVVHGLTGEQLYAKGEHPDAMRTIGMVHLKKDGKVLLVGHSEKPQSLYDNPQLFPQMFPWLFPYGVGGFGNSLKQKKISDVEHKRQLLMYYDKRFQLDKYFPFLAFNQEQIKRSTSAGFLLAEKKSFSQIADRLLNLNMDVLQSLARRLEKGEVFRPESDDEKACYQLMLDLDHIGGKVDGSITNKKYMRNQIWSLTSFKGAPSWYITLSPADVKHPICLYYADTKEKFSPELRDKDDRFRLIARNPVAGARFFHYMVETFLKHVLGVGTDHSGLYGDTSAYYGTVEQQGRLTLHLHLLLWIVNSLTPHEIRQRIMENDSVFQQKLVEYLESVHVGEFLTGTHAEIFAKQCSNKSRADYVDPTQVLPIPPPERCTTRNCKGCVRCHDADAWFQDYKDTVDDLILRSNMHTCSGGEPEAIKTKSANSKKSKKTDKDTDYYGCKNNKWGTCKARFPRKLVKETMVEPETGALLMKKGEIWMNTMTPVLTYLFRCNTDVTSLLSGTAIKAVVAYVSDYITKSSLKTYMLFDAIVSIFNKNSELIGGDAGRQEKARRLMTQVVNSLTAKMEMGAPMACLYLLGNPDHYTGSKFQIFYWKSYVREVRQAWDQDYDTSPDKMVVVKKDGSIVGFSSVMDYMYRPRILEDMTLYDWMRLYQKQKCKPSEFKKMSTNASTDTDWVDEPGSSDDELDVISDSTSEVGDVYSTRVLQSNNEDEGTESDDTFVVADSESDDGTCISLDEPTNNHCTEYSRDSADELNIGVGEIPVEKDEYWHKLLSQHPQSGTHMIHIRPDAQERIPDFVGGPLPRPDQGDREYYCSTMMTLFKPWRSGRNLKFVDQLWDDAFNEFQFTDRQLELMKFFNLKYECLDARDDFSAQRKIDHEKATRALLYPDHVMDELDNFHAQNQAVDEQLLYDDQEDEVLDLEGPQGKHTTTSQKNMQDMENIVKNAGWLDKSPDGLPDVGDITPLVPGIMQDGTQWRKDVLEKKKQALDEKMRNLPSVVNAPDNSSGRKFTSYNEVKVVGVDYLDKNFRANELECQEHIDTTARDFSLNAEQERAFRIVANHAADGGKEQLKMYLGGMGGTGKSQVIKALIQLFEKRNESHRFIVLAPTGSAAALLSGSTYHSVLGINEWMADNQKSFAKIRTRLQGVDYIFFDEVSMLSCRDMYKICAQLSKALNVHDVPFGGINMIFAGDFAQLPPAMNAYSLYSGSVGTQLLSRMELSQQESAIGKALWHQVCTVVILRQNMRQKTQSTEDSKFRKALENMRYKSCTEEDIAFLRTRVAGRGPNRPKISSKRFRNVSIITAWNAHKDKLNELGTIRFAQETGQKLVDFYSDDKLSQASVNKNKSKPEEVSARASRIYKANRITDKVQRQLWDLPPTLTSHLPGKLRLCIGLPIMIRYNDATELCITKGQEGTVAGWLSGTGTQGQRVLDTLFVRLANPPSTVQFRGLPENVVPITPSSQQAKCTLSDDTVININRLQATVLPNFGMTDYASQGKTRPDNPVDLYNCSGHQSVYTCLSRSSTAAGTIIIQGFNSSMITGGCTGYLCQEFRELELLDEITKLKYEGSIPESAKINGHRRNILIKQFRDWKGVNHVPSNIHPSISWSKSHPFSMAPVVNDAKWEVIKHDKGGKSKNKGNIPDYSKFVAANGTVPVKQDEINKRKIDADETPSGPPVKKQKTIMNVNELLVGPIGIEWDNEDWSCAYDAFFTILHGIWSNNPCEWSDIFGDINPYMRMLSHGFDMHLHDRTTIENVRDSIRHKLNVMNDDMFPMDHTGMSIADLADVMLSSSTTVADTLFRCMDCGHCFKGPRGLSSYFIELQMKSLNIQHSDSIADIFERFVNRDISRMCNKCDGAIRREICFNDIPKIFVFHLPHSTVKINPKMKIGGKVFRLRGIVYHGEYHYTARVISVNQNVWFHDGMNTGNSTLPQGLLDKSFMSELNKCSGKSVELIVYSQD